PALATAREHLCDERSAEGEVAGLVAVVHEIDGARQRHEAIVAGHPGVVDVDDFLEDEDLHEEEEVLFVIGVLAWKGDLAVGVDLARVARAEAAEARHVLVLLVEEVVQVGGNGMVVFAIEAPRESFDQRLLAVDVEAEEVYGLEE